MATRAKVEEKGKTMFATATPTGIIVSGLPKYLVENPPENLIQQMQHVFHCRTQITSEGFLEVNFIHACALAPKQRFESLHRVLLRLGACYDLYFEADDKRWRRSTMGQTEQVVFPNWAPVLA